ncbi:MAG: diguanylate cyclase [Pseudomonadota bacterium]
MTGRILIVDPVVTSRIVLKVKLAAAYYAVAHAANLADARRLINRNPPDLIFCEHRLMDGPITNLLMDIRGQSIPVIALVPDDNPGLRNEMLSLGVEDVISRPYDEAVLQARVRTLLRRHSERNDLDLQSGTTAALGLAESPVLFVRRARIGIVAQTARTSRLWAEDLRQRTDHVVQSLAASDVIPTMQGDAPLDALVLGLSSTSPRTRLDLIAGLRARQESKTLAILGVGCTNCANTVATALDTGVGDVMPLGFEPGETLIRVDRLLAHRAEAARRRSSLKAGLEAAVTDPLTGLHNRRYALSFLDRLTRNHCNDANPLALMILDLDHFKRINDSFGHSIGDCVLREFAARIQNVLSPDDLFARVGGEEFLIARPRTPLADASDLANDLCRIVKETPFAQSAIPGGVSVSISVGLAMYDGRGHTTDASAEPTTLGLPNYAINNLIEQADVALYAAKSSGRDKVQVARYAA